MKVLLVATVVQKHIMEFHVPYLKMFKEHGWETVVAARNDYENPLDCLIPYCDHYYDIPFERSPFKTGNITAYKELKKVIDEGHYNIIHCHTPVGAALRKQLADSAKQTIKKFDLSAVEKQMADIYKLSEISKGGYRTNLVFLFTYDQNSTESVAA